MRKPEAFDAPTDEIAPVISLDDWRRAAQVPTSEALAQARAAHPAQLWAEARAAIPS